MTDVKELLKQKAALVEPALRKYAVLGDKTIERMVLHPIEAGGKRLRPAMTLLACEAVGGDPEKIIPAAAAVELLHTFTLVHDDIMDHDEERRGRPTVHKIWGEEMGIMVGDVLYSSAFKALVDVRRNEIPESRVLDAVEALTEANSELQEGQILDMLFEERSIIREDEYMRMITKKTGVLIECSLRIGGILGGADPRQLKALCVFGENAGVAFQIQDDILDLIADQKELGKPIGSDIRKGKKTLIIVHALNNAKPAEKKKLLSVLGKKKAGKKEVDAVIALLRKTGSIDYAKQRVKTLSEDGKNALDALPENDAKRNLIAISDYLMERRY